MCINPETGSKFTKAKKTVEGKTVQRKKNNLNSHVAVFPKKLADFEWEYE